MVSLELETFLSASRGFCVGYLDADHLFISRLVKIPVASAQLYFHCDCRPSSQCPLLRIAEMATAKFVVM